jgi:hypothetical protein
LIDLIVKNEIFDLFSLSIFCLKIPSQKYDTDFYLLHPIFDFWSFCDYFGHNHQKQMKSDKKFPLHFAIFEFWPKDGDIKKRGIPLKGK